MAKPVTSLPFKPGRIFVFKDNGADEITPFQRTQELLNNSFQSPSEIYKRDEGAVFTSKQQVRRALRKLLRIGAVDVRYRSGNTYEYIIATRKLAV